MFQLNSIRKGKLKWLSVEEPKITGSKQALVRPFVAGRCDGDGIFLFHNYTKVLKLGVALHFLDPKVLDTFGKNPFQRPIPVGHEGVGEVMEVGEDVTSVKKGDKVIIPWAISCGNCGVCSKKLYSNCSNNDRGTLVSAFGFGDGMGGWGGMVSDLINVPFADAMLIKLPPTINPISAASLSDNISDAYRTVGPYLESGEQSTVLIMGGSCRSIGLYAAGIAKALGAQRVDYLDFDKERLSIADSLGVNAVEVLDNSIIFKNNQPLLKEGYNITVDASNSVKRLQYALKSLAFGGVCTSTGFFFNASTALPLWDMYLKNATFKIGISHPRRDIPKALEIIQNGSFEPAKVTTLLGDWDSAEESYLAKTTKVILHRKPLFS